MKKRIEGDEKKKLFLKLDLKSITPQEQQEDGGEDENDQDSLENEQKPGREIFKITISSWLFSIRSKHDTDLTYFGSDRLKKELVFIASCFRYPRPDP